MAGEGGGVGVAKSAECISRVELFFFIVQSSSLIGSSYTEKKEEKV